MGFLHLVHGPGAAWLAAESLRRSSVGYAETTAALRRRLIDPRGAEVLVLRGGAGMFFGPFALDPGGHLPARWRILAHTGHLLALRKDDRTVDLVTAAEQSLFPIGPGNLFRSEGLRVKAGDVVTVPGLRIEILAVGPRGPTRRRATFDEPLDQRPQVWIQEGYQGFREVKLPQVGFGAPFDP